MTQRDIEFTTRDDDMELNEILNVMHNSQIVFENCRFSLCTNKQFRNCNFVNCIFEHVTKDTYFTNCTFDAPTFYAGFYGKIDNCNITRYSGNIGNLPEKMK